MAGYFGSVRSLKRMSGSPLIICGKKAEVTLKSTIAFDWFKCDRRFQLLQGMGHELAIRRGMGWGSIGFGCDPYQSSVVTSLDFLRSWPIANRMTGMMLCSDSFSNAVSNGTIAL